jgi:hypothetical protein
MDLGTFKPGDIVVVTREDSKFKGIPQTVVDMSGDYVRIKLNEDAVGHSAGLVSSWLPDSLHRVDRRTKGIYEVRTFHGGMIVVKDNDYRQVWVQTVHESGARGPEFNLNADEVKNLRDALDNWLAGGL